MTVIQKNSIEVFTMIKKMNQLTIKINENELKDFQKKEKTKTKFIRKSVTCGIVTSMEDKQSV